MVDACHMEDLHRPVSEEQCARGRADTQTGSAGFVLNMPMGLRLRDVGLQEEVAGALAAMLVFTPNKSPVSVS